MSMRAVVGRTIRVLVHFRAWSFVLRYVLRFATIAVQSQGRRPKRTKVALGGSCGEVLEPREFTDERELHDARRTVALLPDDELGDTLRVNRRIFVGILLFAVDEN